VPKQPIILTDEIVPPPALIRAGLNALPASVRARGEREPAFHSVLHREHS
jgi:hypothetical protein